MHKLTIENLQRARIALEMAETQLQAATHREASNPDANDLDKHFLAIAFESLLTTLLDMDLLANK